MNGRAKRIALVILVIELIMIGIIAYRQYTYNRLEEPIRFTQEEMSLERSGAPVETGFYVDGSYEGTDRSIRTPAVAVPRGIYQVTVTYETDFFDDMYRIDCASQAFCANIDSSKDRRLSPRHILYRHNQEVSYRINVDNATEITIKNAVTDQASAYLLIRSIEICQLQRLSVIHYTIRSLLFFCILDLLVVLMYALRYNEKCKRFAENHAMMIVGLMMTFLITGMPLFLEETRYGHDVHFHMYRIYGIAESIRSGEYLARIQSVWCGDYGYPVGVYYGQVLLYPPAILYLLGFSLDTAYKTGCVLINVIGILGSYAAFRRISGNRYIGFAGCVIFSASTYRLSTIYMRAAFGESAALSFFPLIVLGLWLIYENEAGAVGWITLAAGATGVILSHVLSVFVAAVYCLFFLLLRWRETFRKEILVSLTKALICSLCLTAYQIVPFLDYMLNVDIMESSRTTSLLENAVPVTQIFANSYQAFHSGDAESLFHEMAPSLGFFGLCVFGIVAYLLLRRSCDDSHALGSLMIISLTGTISATTLFPWGWMKRWIPVIYRLFGHLQFPARLLSGPVVLVALMFVLSLVIASKCMKKELVIALTAVLCFMACFEAMSFVASYAARTPSRDRVWLRDSFSQANGEYLPVGADTYQMREVRVPETEDAALVQATIESRHGTTLVSRVENHMEREAFIDYPVLYYKGYRAAGEDGILPIWGGTCPHPGDGSCGISRSCARLFSGTLLLADC